MNTFRDFLLYQGYLYPRRLPSGTWIAVQQFLFTWGLMVDLDETGYQYRFCYEHLHDALWAVRNWDGTGDPPGPWIKEKGRRGERSNPLLSEGA